MQFSSTNPVSRALDYSGGSPEQPIVEGGGGSEAFGVEEHGGGGVVPHYEYSKVVHTYMHTHIINETYVHNTDVYCNVSLVL